MKEVIISIDFWIILLIVWTCGICIISYFLLCEAYKKIKLLTELCEDIEEQIEKLSNETT